MMNLRFKLEDDKGNSQCYDISSDGVATATASKQCPTIYLSDDPGFVGSNLTLSVTLLGQESHSFDSSKLRFQIDLGSVVKGEDGDEAQPSARLREKEITSVVPTVPDDWSFSLDLDPWSGSLTCVIVHAADKPLVLRENKPIVFKLTKIRGNLAAKPLGTITVTPASFGFGETGLDFTVSLLDAPTGKPKLLDITPGWIDPKAGFPDRGEVITSLKLEEDDKDRFIRNELIFTLANPENFEALVPEGLAPVRGKSPTFYISFVYANEEPGFGALCTKESANAFATSTTLRVANQQQADKWDCDRQLSQQKAKGVEYSTPYWTLRSKSVAVLGTDADAVVELVFSGLICDLPLNAAGDPDVILMYISWENVPGYLPGNTTLMVTKTDQFKLLSFESVPSEEELVDLGTTVKLSWATLGAANSVLTDSATRKQYLRAAGDGEHSYEMKLSEISSDRRFTVTAHRPGLPKQDNELTFKIKYPSLRFSRPLQVTPNLGVTKKSGATYATKAAVAPVKNPKLTWAVDHPELVERYELLIDEDRGHPIAIPADTNQPYEVRTPNPNGISNTTTFRLIAYAKYDVRKERKAESEATIMLYPPMDGFKATVQPTGTTQKIDTTWGLLLHNQGRACQCSFGVTPDPRRQSARVWDFTYDGNYANRITTTSSVAANASLGTSFDVVPQVLVGGRGMDSAAYYFPGSLKSVDAFLKGRTFTFSKPQNVKARYHHPMNINPFKVSVGSNLAITFIGNNSSIIVNYQHKFSTGVFNQNDHNWPKPCAMGVPSFAGAGRVVWPDYVEAWGSVTWSHGNSGDQSFNVRIYLATEPTAKIQFYGNDTWYPLT